MNSEDYLTDKYDSLFMHNIMTTSDALFIFESRLDSDDMQLMGGEPYPHPSN